MGIDSVAGLVDELSRHRLLAPSQQEELKGSLRARFTEPRALARELLQRGWLTPYQVNQIFQGKGPELILGSYILLERLGEGGMAQVFKARQEKLERMVAIKVIRKDRLASGDAIRRFQREIKLLGDLRHPNMVLAYDADQVGQTHYIAMEYVQGVDLGKRVKDQGPVPINDAVDFVAQTAQGLQHAHERGLVHRDIKPSNLLLTTENGRPLIKILDLGLARLLDPEEQDAASSLTRPGLVVGSPDFISPEQARNAHMADIRSDLYSLGCTFYYLLTGKVPHPGGTMTEKLLRHYSAEPTPVEQLRPETPFGVAAVVRKLLAKRPEQRYQTPAELVQALATALTVTAPVLSEPVVAGAGDWAVGSDIPVAVPVEAPSTAAQMLLPTPVPVATLDSSYEAAVPAYKMRVQEEDRKTRQVLIAAGIVTAVFLFLLVVFLLLLGGGRSGRRSNGPEPAQPIPAQFARTEADSCRLPILG